ncbi:MAG: archaeosortase/exosortase family protein [Firmicutes bacterium]|nr:archaeosortase/exosortase family protein [Bacillota bacterium]
MTNNLVARRGPSIVPLWWGLWIVLSVGPVIAYASPLWNNILADTPIADLVWIPIITLGWLGWILLTHRQPLRDDRELNVILGGLLALVAGMALALGPERWPAFFVYDHGGLLLWPVWMLAMVWLFWGIGWTQLVLPPLAYLFLAWPPLFESMANATQGVLVRWADDMLTALSTHVNWLATTAVPGTYSVVFHHIPVSVVVAQACSGADSLIGAAILLPLVWFVVQGAWSAKLVVSLGTSVAALVLNWVRLALIVAATHWIGPDITFGVIHPVLGFMLFALLAVAVALSFRPLGLTLPSRDNNEPYAPQGWLPVGVGVVVGGLTFLMLWPLFSLAQGSFGNPAPLASYNARTFLPVISGMTREPIYYANESSVLGAGAQTQADLYVDTRGVGEAMLELWSTPDANALATYGFQNCLLYHGDVIPAVRSFQLRPGVVATAYAVTLPPAHVGGRRSTYVDVEWNSAVRVHGVIEYQRWSLAAFAASRPRLPVNVGTVRLSGLTPIEAMVAPGSTGHWTASWTATRTELVAIAQQIFARSAG